MDTTQILLILKESIFILSILGFFIVYGMAKGKYALINILFSFYIAILITVYFPYYKAIGAEEEGIAQIVLFLALLVGGIFLFRRHIPGDDYEPAFHGLASKISLALLSTILVILVSFHIVPGAEIISFSSSIQDLFASKEYFFWWLILPLVALYFL